MGRRKKPAAERVAGDVKVSFVLPWDLYERLEAACQRRGTTTSALLRQLLAGHLDDDLGRAEDPGGEHRRGASRPAGTRERRGRRRGRSGGGPTAGSGGWLLD